MKEILTVNEAASILGKHPDTIRLWIQNGKLKATHIPAGSSGVYVLLKEDVLECALERAGSKENRLKTTSSKLRGARENKDKDNQTRLPL